MDINHELAKIHARLDNIEKILKEILKASKKSTTRRRSGEQQSTLTTMGLEEEAKRLFAEGKTYIEIAEILSLKSGNQISKSAVGRFFKYIQSANQAVGGGRS